MAPSRLAWLLIALTPGLAQPVAAQPALDVSLGGALQSLSGLTAEEGAQGSVAGGASAALDLDQRRGRISYDLDLGQYASPGDWRFFLHTAEARYAFDLGERSRLFVGTTGTLRRNGDAWSEADWSGLAGWANLEMKPRAETTVRTGYRIDRRVFADLPSLDQTEHDLFLSVLANLKTRTTLIAESHVGFKSYAGELLSVEPRVEAQAGRGTGVSVSDSGSGPGGGGSGGGSGPAGPADGSGSRGPGPGGMGPSVRPGVSDRPAGDNARQVTVLGRVAQSLGERTGLSLQATWRRTGGSVPPAVVSTPAGFFDDGVYDDPFASDLVALDLRLKHVLAGGAVFEARGRRLRQSYTAELALDADWSPLPGEPLREDRVWRAGLTLSLPLFPGRTGPLALTLETLYDFTDSASNDVFYEYRSHSVFAALAVGY
jgi:hypothetical protein